MTNEKDINSLDVSDAEMIEKEETASETHQEENTSCDHKAMPYIPSRYRVIFPGQDVELDISRGNALKAVNVSLGTDRRVFVSLQDDPTEDNPTADSIRPVGTICRIKQILKSGNVTRVLLEGIERAIILTSDFSGTFPSVTCRDHPFDPFPSSSLKLPYSYFSPAVQAGYHQYHIKNIFRPLLTPLSSWDNETLALARSLREALHDYLEEMSNPAEDLIRECEKSDDPARLYTAILFGITFERTSSQELLETTGVKARFKKLLQILTEETEIAQIQDNLAEEAQHNYESFQRESLLRRQMRLISAQLGEGDEEDGKEAYIEKIDALPLEESDKEKLRREASRLEGLPDASQEAFVIRSYLDTVLELPWNKQDKTTINLARAAKILDQDQYGLEKVKDCILEYIAVQSLTSDGNGSILCFVGPPGVGKTALGKSIARSLGRRYERISLGGVRDESDIRGHRKTYVGAMPGRIADALTRAGTNNPLILLDEVDKMGNDYHGDPAAALLEVLDSEQNKNFRDHYIDVPFDLSHCIFIVTANTLDTIPAPLRDRMEIVEIGSYTQEEKYHIAKEHLIRKQLKKSGLSASQCRFSDEVIYQLIEGYTREAGVRELERLVSRLCRKCARKIVDGKAKRVSFTLANLEQFLGPRKYITETAQSGDIGVVNGLAWTNVGGTMMPLEVLPMQGKGKVECTGSLGDVMRESAKIAVSYTRSVAADWSIDPEFYQKIDLHIHAPEGAVPKDGPSAGVTMVTALISALAQRPVRANVAMTGEITLHGKVLPIGGLREKTMAAYKAGIKTVILPFDNLPDLVEIDPVVREALDFVPVRTIDEVLKSALDDESSVSLLNDV